VFVANVGIRAVDDARFLAGEAPMPGCARCRFSPPLHEVSAHRAVCIFHEDRQTDVYPYVKANERTRYIQALSFAGGIKTNTKVPLTRAVAGFEERTRVKPLRVIKVRPGQYYSLLCFLF